MNKNIFILLCCVITYGQTNAMDPELNWFYGSELHRAAAKGYFNQMLKLIPGANLATQDFCGRHPLYLAAYEGHADIVQLLIKNNADVNQITKEHSTALHGAAVNGSEVVIRMLICAKAELNRKDFSGCTALHIAAINGNLAAVKALIEAGADLNAQDSRGSTPLDLAKPIPRYHLGSQAVYEYILQVIRQR